jgi:hypothetical protein
MRASALVATITPFTFFINPPILSSYCHGGSVVLEYQGQCLSDFRGKGKPRGGKMVVVEKHGGQVWVESKEGAGSSFHLTAPKMEVAQAESQ